MALIEFKNLPDTSTPINAENLNNNFEELKVYELWNNTSVTSDFSSQTITLNDSINNYSYYEIICKRTVSSNAYFSTGRIPSNLLTQLMMISNYNYSRPITNINNKNMSFGNSTYYASYGGNAETSANNTIIPYKVLGYK